MHVFNKLTAARGITGLVAAAAMLGACTDGNAKHTIGGTVSGLAGSGVVLALNGTSELSVPANGEFSFRKDLGIGAAYGVTVVSHPAGLGCTITHASGLVGNADVADVTVSCSPAGVLALTSSNPANGSVAAARSIMPVLNFSAPLSVATANAANVTLHGAAGNLPVAASAAGQVLTITPVRKLLPLTTYTLTAGTGMRGNNGEQLASAATTSFTTRDGAWQQGELRTATAADVGYSPRIAADINGNAFAVWTQVGSVWSSYYEAGIGWRAAERLENTHGANDSPQDLAMDANGNAMAVWEEIESAHCGDEEDCSRKNIWARRFTPDHGWSKAALLATEVSDSLMRPRLAMDAAGNALVLWSQDNGGHRNLWSRRYAAHDGWGSAKQLETGDGSVSNPSIAMNADGAAIAVWEQLDGAHLRIWSSRHATDTGWSEAVVIDTDDVSSGAFPQVAMDDNGNATAVWLRSDAQQGKIWSNHYDAGAGWGTPQLIDTPQAGNAILPRISMDAAGNALVVWDESDPASIGVYRTNIWAARYVANAGWGAAMLIENDDAGSANSPLIVADARGNALAVWAQSDGAHFSVWSNRYVADAGWSTPVTLENNNSGDSFVTGIAMDGSGDATAMWMQQDGEGFRVFSGRFE